MERAEKEGKSQKDLYNGETYSRVLSNSDLIFTGLPTWFFLCSLLSLVVVILCKFMPQTDSPYLVVGLLSAVVFSLFIGLIIFHRGKKNVKAALLFDFCTTIGLLEILLLVLIYTPLMIFIGFKS